jgi:hypothetical protein
MIFTLIRAAPRTLRATTSCHRRLATAPNLATALPAHYVLPSGDKIPAVALGVWQAQPDDARKAVAAALGAGYRHIDGAWAYRNEKEVGQVVHDSGLKVGRRSPLRTHPFGWRNPHSGRTFGSLRRFKTPSMTRARLRLRSIRLSPTSARITWTCI